MAFIEHTLSRPDIGLPPYRYVVETDIAVDGTYTGVKLEAGVLYGIENIWQVKRGIAMYQASAAVANRNISLYTYFHAGGPIGQAIGTIWSENIAANQTGFLSWGGMGVLTDITMAATSIHDYIQVTKDFIIKGLDRFYCAANNPQAGDKLSVWVEFEYLNRAMGVKERL